MSDKYESFLSIHREGRTELYRNGLPVATVTNEGCELNQFRDAAGNKLPHTKEHLRSLFKVSETVYEALKAMAKKVEESE